MDDDPPVVLLVGHGAQGSPVRGDGQELREAGGCQEAGGEVGSDEVLDAEPAEVVGAGVGCEYAELVVFVEELGGGRQGVPLAVQFCGGVGVGVADRDRGLDLVSRGGAVGA
ncbi:hypothetical protein O1L60_18515 [Streptomyces diastatochromogenes]|nr:hypothetical protein [Streptomyces diastatochromogenes]